MAVVDQPTESTDGGAPPAQRDPARRAWWALVRVPVTMWAKVWAVLLVVSWASIELLDRHPSYPKPPAVFRGTQLLEGWFRWDGNWYQLIVQDGYFYDPAKQSSVAFFPAYPLTVKVVNVLIGDVILAAILVSLVCGLGATVLVYRWACRKTSPETARLTVVVLVLYPYAWYLFGAVYADALFLVAAIGAFVLLDRDHPVLAGLLGIVATAARPVGVGVMIGLVAVMLEQRGVIRIAALDRVRASGWHAFRRREEGDPKGVGLRLRALRARNLGVGLSVLGLGAWSFYLWRTWGDPVLFATTEAAPGWDQAAGARTWFKYEWFEHLANLPTWIHDSIWRLDVRHYSPWSQTLYTLGITLQAAFVLLALALVPRVLRRFGWGYALYVLAVVAIPLLGSKDFQGTGRYMLAAFPCFVVVAEWLGEHRRARRIWLPISTALLIFGTSLFARGYYVA